MSVTNLQKAIVNDMNPTLDAARHYLSSDKVLYADMIDILARGMADVLAAGPTGVLIFDHGSQTHMMTMTDEATLESFLAILGGPPAGHIVVHESFAVPVVTERFGFRHVNECKQSAYLGGPIPLPGRDDLRLETLDPSWTQAVTDQYSLKTSAEEIRERLEAGAIVGAFRDGTLLGFIGYHAEGSLGMLEVYPQFRHEGIGSYLVAHMVNRTLAEGRVPFDQIIVGNVASEALQTKLGFTISQGRLWWMSAGLYAGPCCGDIP